MSKTSIVVGATLAVLGVGGLAFGAWQVQQPRGPVYAEILAVEPVTRTVERPREVCEDVERVVSEEVPVEVPVQVPVEAPTPSGPAASRDPHRIVGSAAGALVGGLLGNQVGGGQRQEDRHRGGCHRRRPGRTRGSGARRGAPACPGRRPSPV